MQRANFLLLKKENTEQSISGKEGKTAKQRDIVHCNEALRPFISKHL